MAGGKWPRKARAALVELCEQDEDASLAVKLMADVKGIFDSRGADKLFTIDILHELVEIEDRPWAVWWFDDLKHEKSQKPASRLARMLKPYGTKKSPIKSHTIWIGDESAKGYEVGDFKQAFDRYLPCPEKAVIAVTAVTHEGKNVTALNNVTALDTKAVTRNSPRERAQSDGVTAVTASQERESDIDAANSELLVLAADAREREQ
jgi:putative DNA primase/helicase